MPSSSAPVRELLVLDPRMAGWPQWLAAATEEVAVLVLDVTKDGLAQVAEVAAELAPLTSIRIADPLREAGLPLAARCLTLDQVPEQDWRLDAIGQALRPEGRLVLRQSSPGMQDALVQALAGAIGRAVVVEGPVSARRPAAAAQPRRRRPSAWLAAKPAALPPGPPVSHGMRRRVEQTGAAG